MKNVILLTSAFFSYLAYSIFVSRTIDVCDIYCYPNNGAYHKVVLFFPFVLIFSLVTYKLPKTISHAWIKYSIFAIPIVLFISTYINLELHHKPYGSWQGMFDPQVLGLLYTLYSVGSLIAIFVGWKNYKKLQK